MKNPHYLSEVIKQELNYVKGGGKPIFHLPILHIVDKYNYRQYLRSDFNSMSYSIN